MPMQRQTARKVRIVDIVSGEWVKKEGMEPSYVVTPSRESISRARITGTVVGKFVSEDGNFSSVTIDDSTATIRAKLWREIELLNSTQTGDLVSLIGKVREYEGEIYIVPEIIRQVTPDEEGLFRLEVLAKMKKGPAPVSAEASAPGAGRETQEPAGTDETGLRKKVLSVIESNKEGVKYGDLMQQVGAPEEALEGIINELLGEGVCYEPTPGKIKKI
jgi:RPA family protein